MIAKLVAIVCLVGVAQAGYLHGSGLGYSSGYGYGSYGHGGYGGYGSYGLAPAYASYSAPIVKTIAPVVSYAPAVSSVSRYDVHSAPIVKSYVAPVASYSYSPSLSYGSYGYGNGGYGYGHGGYGSGYGSGYGYGSYGGKYLW